MTYAQNLAWAAALAPNSNLEISETTTAHAVNCNSLRNYFDMESYQGGFEVGRTLRTLINRLPGYNANDPRSKIVDSHEYVRPQLTVPKKRTLETLSTGALTTNVVCRLECGMYRSTTNSCKQAKLALEFLVDASMDINTVHFGMIKDGTLRIVGGHFEHAHTCMPNEDAVSLRLLDKEIVTLAVTQNIVAKEAHYR